MTDPSPILPVYRRSAISMVRGEGVWLFDETGKRYLDFAAGIAVNALGHNHPRVTAALQAQVRQLWHCSNYFTHPGLEAASQRLVDLSDFAHSVFFSSSGAEANEAGIKFIRKAMDHRGEPDRFRIITMAGGFHGRTMACISACQSPRATQGYGPLLDGFDQVPFHDLAALEASIGPQTAGILLEPIQGEGGVHVHSAAYLQGARALADKHGLILWFDEVQCGLGRTGSLFCYQDAGMRPDMLTIAKGLGNGFPVAATLVTEAIASALTPGCHGSTFGSNPLAMAVVGAVLEELASPALLANVRRVGEHFGEGLRALAAAHPSLLAEARGLGLMQGLQTRISAFALNEKLRAAGLLVVPAGESVLRLLPPLIITEADADAALAILHRVCGEWE